MSHNSVKATQNQYVNTVKPSIEQQWLEKIYFYYIFGFWPQKSQKNKSQENNFRQWICFLISGAVAPMPSKTAIAPLDRTKIYFQTNQEIFSLRASFNYLTVETKKEGFSSLWRGNSAAILRARWFSVGICKYKPDYKSHDLL